MPPTEAAGPVSELIDFVENNEEWVAPIVFLLAFAESLVVVSLFVPSTLLFLGIGAAHSAADGSFVTTWLAGSTGAVLGDVVSFAFGWYFKRDVMRLWPFSTMPRLLARSRLMFARYGYLAIVVGKFLGNFRPFLPIVAGALRMPWRVFIPASIVSSFLWAGAFLAPGYGVVTLFK